MHHNRVSTLLPAKELLTHRQLSGGSTWRLPYRIFTSGLSEKQPKGKILPRKIVPESVIQILKMKPGELCEWVAVASTVIPVGTQN
jgi:hypothetical protein